MSGFIDLRRRFRDLLNVEPEQRELEETDILASLGEMGFGSGIGWPELLEHPRVVILAEAGAGKTTEMREQARALVEEGRFAFYVPLESLDREQMTGLFLQRDRDQFEAWKADGQEPAWFFLDAVDELKLTKGRLDRALLRFSRDIHRHLVRVRMVDSSRPSDWRSSADLETVNPSW